MLRQEPKVSERGVNKFIAVDEMNAKYLQLRDRLKAEAAAHAEARASEEETPARPADEATPGKATAGSRARRTPKPKPRTDDLAEARS
jgi:hypothetical protein